MPFQDVIANLGLCVNLKVILGITFEGYNQYMNSVLYTLELEPLNFFMFVLFVNYHVLGAKEKKGYVR